MKFPYRLPILLGAAHALNDLVSGYVLATYANDASATGAATLFLLYGMLAFGGQLPVGWLLDKYPRIRATMLLALATLAAGLGLMYADLPLAAVTAVGIASAALHVAGGTWVWMLSPRQSGMSGIFIAPGVAGLGIGSVLGGHMQTQTPLYALIAIGVLAAILWLTTRRDAPLQTPISADNQPLFDSHDAWMLLILGAICMRSMLWNILNLVYAGNDFALLSISFSAFSGKMLGGFLADALGAKRWLWLSLPLAALLLAFWAHNLVALCVGAALLQSSTPLMLRLMHTALPQQPAAAVGFSLGLAIALAGLPMYVPSFSEYAQPILWLLCLLLPLYGFWLMRKWQ